jgi:uncharacterized integral membrane protein (TIGR00698 family)
MQSDELRQGRGVVDAGSEVEPGERPARRMSEDWLAVLIGGVLLLISLLAVFSTASPEQAGSGSPTVESGAAAADTKYSNPLKALIAVPGKWESEPLTSLYKSSFGIVGAFLISMVVFGIGVALNRGSPLAFVAAFVPLFLLSLLAYVLSEQTVIKHFGLEYALWALFAGLLIGHTIGTPAFMKPAIRTELYIKVGLVLLGAEVLFGKLLALGLPGVFVAWIVTPIVLISTFWFGQKILKIESASLNMVISADMSVCGVSAAIATASACKAKKEELSTAIGISLAFTVVMMIVMPYVIRLAGIDPIVGGAWIGGTIDSTGAVGAAGAMLGKDAEVVATTIKMIQNILIGVVAFGVAVYWVAYVDRTPDAKPDAMEIWRRFPKFILGFLGASILMSVINDGMPQGSEIVKAVIDGSTKTLRGWCFCMAFVSIGLETNFKTLAKFFKGGKPLTLYVCGQTLNLILTLLMSWLMFKVVFPNAADVLSR